MLYLQSIYSIILNSMHKATGRLSRKTSNAVITLSCAGLISFFICFFMPKFWKYGIKGSLTLNTGICSIMLFLIILFGIKGELKSIKWNPFVFFLFFFAGAGVMAISFLHPIGKGYRAWALLMMFGFPCLYYVWNNRGDYNELYKRLSAATVIVGIIFYVYCFIRATNGKLKIVSERITGAFYDANMLSMIGMIMVCCAFYMLLVNRQSKAWFALTALGFGVGTDIVLLGESRLSILIVVGSLFAFSVFYIKCREDYGGKSRSAKLLRTEIILLSLIIFILAGKLMVEVNAKAVDEDAEAQTASVITYVYQDPTTPGESPLDRFSPDGQDLNAYTAGRVNIWKNYAQFLNMTGNDFNKADWAALTGDTVKHAHNNFLEIGFRCGVPVAILHTLLELVAGIICIIFLFGRKYRDPSYLFSIVFMVSYAVESLFDIATLPFERPAPFFFYMAMLPVFMFGSNKVEEGPKHLE